MPGACICRLEGAGLFLPGTLDRRLVLKDVDWEIAEGDHTVLAGRNGAGKTTMLRLIHGEAWTTRGSISWLDGDAMSRSRVVALSRTSMVSPEQQETFQRNAWAISGRELLLTGYDGTPMLYSEPEEERAAAAEALAHELGAEDLLERNIRELSQGQLRILLLGRALVRRPLLLLLDECTDGLDERRRGLFLQALERVSSTSTVVMTTHRESMLPGWVGTKRYIEDGRLLPPGEAPRRPLSQVRERVVLSAPPPGPRDGDAAPLVEVENATVFIDGTEILHGLNWRVRRGENWLLEGENGSGKSTFLRMLAGDEQVAWPGRISFALPGREEGDIPFVTLRRRVRLISDQAQALYDFDVTCLELVLSGLENTVGLYREYSEEERLDALRQLARVGLEELADASIRRISTGQLRRVFLARALQGRPILLLLDEACTGLDEQSRAEYLDVLDRLADEGLSYVFVSHYREDAPASINRRALMRDGRLEIVS